MRRSLAAVALLSLLSLAACEKRSTDPLRPVVQAAQPVVPSLPDPSLPPASTAVTPSAAPTAQDDAGGRVTGTLSRAQETSAMPMPGQVNNHSSTALDPAKRGASAP
jgi:hypothetical protein